MKWSERTWEKVIPVYEKILEHPFIKELMDGTLGRDKFVHYISQDTIYLYEYGKVLAGIASKMTKLTHMRDFLYFTQDSIAVEISLHESFLHGTDKMGSLKASPSCLLYTSYLHKQLAASGVEVASAAVLPCFWVYKKVGDYILQNQTKIENPYQNWINTYGGDEFEQAVETAINICDELAENTTPKTQDLMTEVFVTATKMEWMFWDGAWRLEQWTV